MSFKVLQFCRFKGLSNRRLELSWSQKSSTVAWNLGHNHEWLSNNIYGFSSLCTLFFDIVEFGVCSNWITITVHLRALLRYMKPWWVKFLLMMFVGLEIAIKRWMSVVSNLHKQTHPATIHSTQPPRQTSHSLHKCTLSHGSHTKSSYKGSKHTCIPSKAMQKQTHLETLVPSIHYHVPCIHIAHMAALTIPMRKQIFQQT